jgi:hypothetical protein
MSGDLSFEKRTQREFAVITVLRHCKKKESVSALLRNMALHMTDDSLNSKRNIFTATHSVFLHQIDRGALASTRRGFFPAYRMGIGKNSDMVGKIPPWKWDMVGKIPT